MRFSILAVAALAALLGAARPASACDVPVTERAERCPHHHHCGPWIPGRYETRWEWRTVDRYETRRIVCGWRTERVPATREVYDVSTDTYVTRTAYDVRLVQVPEYRTETVLVRRTERVPVTIWVPGSWACCRLHPCR